ncbi:MAG TPA: BON domain-containing protein [Solirubrobacteraceae bacterium]|nr:BON domain-containing protein [Solirubrobacteraceae bacterium]
MTNESIAEHIWSRYERDDRIPHPAEIAISEQAGTVTLRGTVRSLRQLRAAVDIAKAARGVRWVENELTVDPRDRQKDGELRGAALRALMSHVDVPGDRIDVHVSDGWLTLSGEVKRQEETNAAFEAVAHLEGVGGITNEIKVITSGIA